MSLLAIVWSVKPELVDLGFLQIRWYGLFFAASFFCGYLIFQKIIKKESLDIKFLDDLLVYVAVGTVLGARLGHCLFYQPDYYLANPLEILYIWHGGLASHGGAAGILIALIFFCRKYKVNFIWVLDRLVIPIALAGFFIRMGNLMNSEIYGYETNLPWGFMFVLNGETAYKHPTQVYEALSYLLIFGYLFFLYFRKNTEKLKDGLLLGLFLVLVFLARFLIEFVKEVQVDFENNLTLNMGQLLSLPFIIWGLYLLWNTRKKVV